MRVKATLIKLSTDDGIIALNDELEVDKVMAVELDSLCVRDWAKPENRLGPEKRFSIFVYKCFECVEGYWLPLELLKLEAE